MSDGPAPRPDDGPDGTPDPVVTVGAIDGAVLLLAAGKASVPPERLPDLVERTATRLRGRRETYRRTCERVHADDAREIFFADRDHWTALGEELGFDERETDAVRRAHEEQLRHVGRRTDRETEFDHALDIRRAVVVGRPSEGGEREGT